MFRRKNSRAAAHAANAPPTSTAASTAALQAFLASRASADLSSAAAAAALRSHTTSPTNPASIQTKRMQRRLSNSSNGSAATAPALQRQGSNGSMTERTFRDSSPLRSGSPLVDHPPIPPIPKNLPKRAKGGMGRPASTEPPQRVTSPGPKVPGGRVVSLDRGNVKPKNEAIPPMPKTKPKPKKIDTLIAAEQPAKRGSINFSRPMSPTLSSPTSPLPPANGRIGKPDSSIISADDVDAIDYSLKNEATAPVRRKKKRVVKEVVEGSHLALGHSNAKPTGTAFEAERSTERPNGRVSETLSSQESDSDTSFTEKSWSAPMKAARPSNTLTKQPSMVREDHEGEALAERELESQKLNTGVSSTPIATPNGKALAAPGVTPIVASQILTPPPSGETIARRASPSPARTARFSSQPVSDISGGIRHEPLPRAMSPAKSAMKYSPSPRGPSPALLNNDVSDNVSVASEDGRKKKKSARVSFDESPVIVGEAADFEPTKSPFILSPQNKDSVSRHLFQPKGRFDDQEPDEIISPIPTLPSFGSIRGQKDRHPDEHHKTLYGDEQARRNLAEMTSSTDRALAAIIAGDLASTHSPADPIPPQVTSVEGSGEHSDSESMGDEDSQSIKTVESPDVVPIPVEDQTISGLGANTASQKTGDVPMIAVVPATPGHEADNSNRDSWLSGMPGSFNPRDSPFKTDSVKSDRDTSTAASAEQTEAAEPRRESIVEPEPESAQREHSPESPTIGTIAESLRRQEDDESASDTGDSVYSDAAEDPVDLEGDGFGSINAIVDSPVVKPVTSVIPKTSKGTQRAPDESPSPTGRVNTAKDWESTKSYWSDINESKKAQIKPEAVGVAISPQSPKFKKNEPTSEGKQPVVPPKSAARATKRSSQPPTAPTVPAREASAPKKSALKKSARPNSEQLSNQNEVPSMRKTMRGPSPASSPSSNTAPRSSMVGRLRQDSTSSQPSVVASKAQSTLPTGSKAVKGKKPSAKAIQPPLANGSANRMSTISNKSSLPTQTPRPAPRLTRTMSNDSDSSSSFKRERRKRPQQSGAYSMKRSMRDSQPPAQASTGTARDTTSTSRNRPMSVSGVSLRTSMRDKTSIPPRPSSVRVASPSGSFFGRKKKVEDKPIFSRKFSDSSAEDVPTRFASRFRDSSDEEEVLTPVRGIPRSTLEEDSTDLEDSDMDSKPAPAQKSASGPSSPAIASKSMRAPIDRPTPAVTNLTMQTPPDKKKRSFFGVLGRRKDKSKIGKSELDSAARRDTPLERTKLERSALDNRVATPEPATPAETPVGSPAGSPSPAVRPAKLQRRNTPQRMISDSWPLPPSPPPDLPTVVRPTTSDGIPSRPPIGFRQISNVTNIAEVSAIGRTGKKKRFPMLRKAFGLHD